MELSRKNYFLIPLTYWVQFKLLYTSKYYYLQLCLINNNLTVASVNFVRSSVAMCRHMVSKLTFFFQDYLLFWVPVTELISAQQSGLAKMTYQASSVLTFSGKSCCSKNLSGYIQLCDSTILKLKWKLHYGYIFFLLAGFDLISQFQIEKAASQGIIERVVGSTSLQVAYKLGPNVDFRIPTR